MRCARTARGALVLLASVQLFACGRATSQREPEPFADAASPSDQALVPAELRKTGMTRYFVLRDVTRGPELWLFEDPHAPRVVPLSDSGSTYAASDLAWSASGQRLAYGLTATTAGTSPPNRLLLADAESGFVPRALEHDNLLDYAHRLAWIGDRALLVVTARYLNDFDLRGYDASYAWVDADSGVVTDLGRLPPAEEPYDVPTRDPSDVDLATSSAGALYTDSNCDLVYRPSADHEQTLIHDCQASATWSDDGSFALVSQASARSLYALVDGRRLELAPELSAALAPFASAKLAWAPHAARFVLSEASSDSSGELVRLAYGDASSSQLSTFDALPPATSARFVSDDLLLLSSSHGEPYLLDVRQLASGSPPEFLGLGVEVNPLAALVSSSDSRHLYNPQDPFVELELEAGTVRPRGVLFDEPSPVGSVYFRLLQTDSAGLLTMVEPAQGMPAEQRETMHQYLVTLGAERAAIPLGSFEHRLGTASRGVETFQSAPQFGGIFFVSSGESGHAVDWLGFDDIARKVHLADYTSGNAGLEFPAQLAPH
jgi:hypothetical protein